MSDDLRVDGRALPFVPGESVLEALRRAGSDVPTLCHADGLSPEGGCRLCLVELEGAPRPVAACHAPATPGMVVRTSTERLESLRRGILSLLLSEHPAGTFAADPEGTPFEQLLSRCGVEDPPLGAGGAAGGEALDESHPYLRFARERCIECRLCLHACEEIQGQFVYGAVGRGGDVRLAIGPTDRFADSPCVACGACVDLCPTAAVSDVDRAGGSRAEDRDVIATVCGYCGVGCRIAVESRDGAVLRVDGVGDAAVNRGHLCVKGRYAHAFHRSPDRLTRPLLREGEGFRPVGWDEALDFAARRLREIRDRHGPDALGVMTSSRSTNEAAYLFQKLFRTAIGTNNVDCCARVCHSSTALGLQTVTGTGAATASYVDIERAGLIVVAGANPTEAHPVVGARIKQAALGGTPLVVIDPRRIELAEYAGLHLPVRPGTNVPLFNALAKVLVERGLVDREYVSQRTEGFDEFADFVTGASLDDAAAVTGVPASDIEAAALQMGERRPVLFVHGLGLSELTQGTESVIALSNLGLLTGSPGRPGAGMLPLRGQNNVQGAADMGGMPNAITGYRPVADASVRDHAARIWGSAPPPTPGRTIPEMIDAAAAGEIRGLWIQGEDVAQSDPNQQHVIRALERLELLVVLEIFPSETVKYADLVLPAASFLEQEGTFTNGERRIQHVRPVVPAPGESRPDWVIACDLARALGESWSYDGPDAVMDEIAQVAPALFGGVRYDRLGPDGIQWPCPTDAHAGTQTVHAEGFVRGRAPLTRVPYAPTPEQTDDRHPFLLVTGRVLDHYNVGTMTRRTPNARITDADYLELHPDDARRLGVADGGRVELTSRYGRTETAVTLTDRVAPGTAFLSFHFPETHANAVTSPHVDPLSKCPEYKVTAVRIAPVVA